MSPNQRSEVRGQRSVITLLALAIAFSGCATLPGSDPVVVNSEKTTQVAFDVFDAFVTLEYNNRAQLAAVSPEIHKYAEVIRRNGLTWLGTARSLTKAYKTSRTPENKASLLTAVSVLQTAIAEAQKYIAQANKVSGSSP
jgi:hypothetical protein